MLSSINFAYAYNHRRVGIINVNVANPWNGTTYTGKQSYRPDQILRWDIFKVTPNNTSGTTTPPNPTSVIQRIVEDFRNQ
jgi:hypothetical protein